ncbi:U32 family peptidase [bacterium]|nr:U32 family peptidase [bacterium]
MEYKFSTPMPCDKEKIQALTKINNEVEKSKITSLYFALPINSPEKTGFEQLRTIDEQHFSFEDFIPYIELTKKSGFDFIYLLNSPKPLLYESDFLDEQLEKLDSLINRLRKLGCYKYRLCNVQLIDYLSKKYTDIEIYASTSLEYQNIKQYINFMELYPNIKEIVPAVDLNKNFKLLKNLKQKFPGLIIELMVNEGCLYSCPLRYLHNLSLPYSTLTDEYQNSDFYTFFLKSCFKLSAKHIYEHICNHNIIYPWEIDDYGKIGVENFKIVGRNAIGIALNKYVEYYLAFFKGIDNYNNIKNIPIYYFNHYFSDGSLPFTVNELRKYLPNIKHFKKYGHLCSSSCGITCNYCEKCAQKIQKDFSNRMKKYIKY